MVILAIGDSILGQRCVGELQPELLVAEPEDDALPTEATLAIDSPVAEPRVALLIEAALDADREGPFQLLLTDRLSRRPPQDLGGTPPTIRALLMSPVDLSVEIGQPALTGPT
jgi:hypothetical protein